MTRSLLLATLALVSCACLGQQPIDAKRYALRERFAGAEPFRRPVAFSAIPFDKAYAELSPEHQAMLKSQYNAMAEADEPPYPIGGLKEIFGPVARGQRQLLVDGDVEVDVEVSASGEAVSARVMKTPGNEATQLVAGVALLVKYKPGACAGQPCAMWFPVRVKLESH